MLYKSKTASTCTCLTTITPRALYLCSQTPPCTITLSVYDMSITASICCAVGRTCTVKTLKLSVIKSCSVLGPLSQHSEVMEHHHMLHWILFCYIICAGVNDAKRECLMSQFPGPVTISSQDVFIASVPVFGAVDRSHYPLSLPLIYYGQPHGATEVEGIEFLCSGYRCVVHSYCGSPAHYRQQQQRPVSVLIRV